VGIVTRTTQEDARSLKNKGLAKVREIKLHRVRKQENQMQTVAQESDERKPACLMKMKVRQKVSAEV
jgi:hypothetical protein